MDQPLDATAERLLGRAFADAYPESFLADLSDVENRMGGHPGEREAAGIVAEAFEDALGGSEERPFPVRRWHRGRTELAAGGGDGEARTFEAIALPYSPGADLHAPLVDASHGTPDKLDECDVRGAVVLAEQGGPGHAHRMEKFGHAAAAGAEAFVLVNDTEGGLPVTGTLRFGDEAAIPGVGVSKETGERMRRYAAAGGSATLRVEAETDDGTARNVHATKPGTGERDGRVVVVAHFDAHDVGEGALDNGCGATILAEAARLLADVDFPRDVTFAAVSCEETGLMGSHALADALDLEDVTAVVNVDGAGRARNLKAYTHASAAVETLARSVADAADHPLAVEDRPHAYSDHWPFLREGVPCLQLHSEPADETVPWGPRGKPVVHTRADTLDKVEFRDVREHAGLTALLVRELARREAPPRLDTADLARRLHEADAERGMRAAGVWPDGW
jgi:Zn-dependent M28 family amino/carboxypeptidase